MAANNALFMFFIEHLQREPTCCAYVQVAVNAYRNSVVCELWLSCHPVSDAALARAAIVRGNPRNISQ
jgi:hypothetical protein